MSRRLPAWVALLGASAVLGLSGCSFTVDAGGPMDGPGIAAEDPGPIDIPAECDGVGVGWYPGVDIANVESQPQDWPAPPAESTLCSTAGGGNTETATYANAAPFDAIVAHYADALPAGYTGEQSTGEENGTGYATLDGAGSGVRFQVRETEGGFTLVFTAD